MILIRRFVDSVGQKMQKNNHFLIGDDFVKLLNTAKVDLEELETSSQNCSTCWISLVF